MRRSDPVPLTGLDTAAIARSLSQVAERERDLVDAYFERLEEVELAGGAEAMPRVRREEGFAVRLSRGARTWLSSRDGFRPGLFQEALRQVARVWPAAPYPEPDLVPPPFPEVGDLSVLERFPRAVERAIRARHVGFPLRLTVRRHRRWLQVVGTRLVPEPESETYYSCATDLPWGRYGAVYAELDKNAVESVSTSLTDLFRARDRPPPEAHSGVTVLGPAAAAVLLHEVVSHALETDTLVLGGRAEAAVGVTVGSRLLSVLDDPGSAPEGLRRSTDDEGTVVARRWLLRHGVVEQPLADQFSARSSRVLVAGAARRGSRHLPPAPRSTHLELLPGDESGPELLDDAAGGLLLPEVSRGSLDPLTGRYSLTIPYARRIREGKPGEYLGPGRLGGLVGELLGAIRGVGLDSRSAGAGWCAKGGVKLPVWATTPTLRIEGVELEP